MQERNPHIGELIKKVVAQKGIKTSWIAEQLGCHRNNVYLIFSRSWIDTETLMKLSRILNYDFFAELSEWFRQE
ncbi:MAG: helix-turn-helix domain-containing protein [Bacteroidales bacterium]|nr:helix-turn-helix domain-containing protein [Bacteroidales bacterium]